MEIAVIRFPGTNNEHETVRALESFDVSAQIVDHRQDTLLNEFDGYWLAGGFSYADVLRAGAIAAQSPIIADIASSGLPVFGVCNGFQILTEAKLLPGALLPNKSTRFVCKWVYLRINDTSLFPNPSKQVLKLPIAHFEGNLYQSEDMEPRAFLKYCDKDGNVTAEVNPNGSSDNIAGLISESNQFMGMMPHPERASFKYQGSTDGRLIIQKFLDQVKK